MNPGVEAFQGAYEQLARERGGDALHGQRQEAWRRFRDRGLPTVRDEEWRFTNVAPLTKRTFALARPGRNGAGRAEVEKLGLGAGLVFVDGHYRADLSAPPAGVRVESLSAALERGDGLVHEWLGRELPERPFIALNAAFLEDGAFVHLPKGGTAPVLHVLFLGTGKACHPRNVYVAAEGAEARIVETYASVGDEAHFTNSVSEIFVGRNASLEHYRLQLEHDRSFHFGTVHVRQERDSRFTSHAVTLGGALTRNDVTASLDAEGCLCTLNGLFLAQGTQHVDNHTWIEHRQPNCESHELYKGILDDRSSGVFSGYIHVFPDAQKTDAFQASANLLLSDEATVDSQPQLEIYADDVKCSHGSTVGQLDRDALFYLRARGIPEARAYHMLIQAFARDVTERLGVAPARERIERLLLEKLPGGA